MQCMEREANVFIKHKNETALNKPSKLHTNDMIQTVRYSLLAYYM